LPSTLPRLDPLDIVTHYKQLLVHTIIYSAEDKSAESFLKAVDYVVKWYRKFGKIVKKIRTDYEAFASFKLIYEYYDRPDINIIPQMSIPYEHWLNAAVERDV
jgi:hypothetical protein